MSKNFDGQMQRMDEKLDKKRQDIEDKEAELDSCSKKVSIIVFTLLKWYRRPIYPRQRPRILKLRPRNLRPRPKYLRLLHIYE